MILMVYDPGTTKFILCAESKNRTKNGMHVTFVDFLTGREMRYMYIQLVTF
jgi:hypothetical protein